MTGGLEGKWIFLRLALLCLGSSFLSAAVVVDQRLAGENEVPPKCFKIRQRAAYIVPP